MTGWWNIPNYTCWIWSARLFYRRSFFFFYLPTTRLQRAAHFFSFSAFFLNVSLDSFSSPLAGCTEYALNPVQVVVGGTHTQKLAPRAVFDLPLFHVLQHTEGPALCKIGGRGGGGQSLLSWHWLKLLSITREQSSSVGIFFFFCGFESSTLLTFLFPFWHN